MLAWYLGAVQTGLFPVYAESEKEKRPELSGQTPIPMLRLGYGDLLSQSHELVDYLRQSLSRLHPDHFRIARAAFWIGLFTISAKLIAASKEIAVAWRYGRGAEVDAYNLALTLSTWLPVTLVSVLTVVLVPALARLRDKDEAQRTQLLAELKGLGWLGAMAAMLFVVLFYNWGLSWFASGLDSATLEMTRDMLLTFIPLAALTVFVGLNTVRLQASNDHRYALADGLPPLAIILLLWALQTAASLPLLAGTLLGTSLQVLWLAQLVSHHEGVSVSTKWRLKSVEWPMLWRSAMIMGAGQIAMSFTTPIDQYFAANLGTGAIATLGYANRLISLGLALGATVVVRATLLVFSEAVAKGELQHARVLAFKWAGLMVLAGFAAATLCHVFAPWLVELLFQRGAFAERDTLVVADVLRHGIWQWPFYLGGLVLVQYLVASNRFMLAAISGVIALLAKMLFTAMLVRFAGINGIVLGTTMMYVATLLWFIWCSGWKWERHVDGR